MSPEVSEIDSTNTSARKTKTPLSNWWFVLLALPFGYVLQVAFTTTFNHINNEATSLAALIIDVFVFVRAIIGIIWQPQSKEWKWYLALFPFSVLLIWFLLFLGSVLARR